MVLAVRGSIPGGGEIFRTLQKRLWANSMSYKMGTGLFPIEKQLGLGVNHALLSVIDVKERGVL